MKPIRKIRFEEPIRKVRLEDMRIVPVLSNKVVVLGGIYNGKSAAAPSIYTTVYYDGEDFRYPEDIPDIEDGKRYTLKKLRHTDGDMEEQTLVVLVSNLIPVPEIRLEISNQVAQIFVGYIRSGFSKTYYLNAPEVKEFVRFAQFVHGSLIGHKIENEFKKEKEKGKKDEKCAKDSSL